VCRILALAVCCSLVAIAVADEPEPPSPHVDIKGHAKQNLKDDLGTGKFTGNNLAALPRGVKKLAGVRFHITDRIIHLGREKDRKVEGVKVGRTLGKLHFLHATEHSAPDGTQIAKYVVHYEDKTKAEVEVVYGKDVVDWWAYPTQAVPTRAKIAWEGENEPAKGYDAKIRLYLTTWKNPHPKKKVVSLDFVATGTDTSVVPFCAAITVEK
jgi:hypothetical protein